MSITFVFITMRKNPCLNWFVEGLKKQAINFPELDYQILVVDYLHDEREFPYTHVSPLPSYCQGKYKLTKKNWWDAPIARNTAFCYAIHPYIVFVDDLLCLGERWLEAVIEGCGKNEVLIGSNIRVENLVVENGSAVSYDIKQPDGRDALCTNGDKVKCDGSSLYGSCFAVPLELALEVNGFDEMQAISSYEDTPFGIRLGKITKEIYYDKRMLTIEAQDKTGEFVMHREDPEVSKERYFELLAQFGHSKTCYDEIKRYDCSHLIIDTAVQGRHRSFKNNYDLRKLRTRVQNGETITPEMMNFPDTYWFNNVPLREL